MTSSVKWKGGLNAQHLHKRLSLRTTTTRSPTTTSNGEEAPSYTPADSRTTTTSTSTASALASADECRNVTHDKHAHNIREAVVPW